MKLGYLLVIAWACPLVAQAEIYKAVDENGHVTYSSSPIKGGKKLMLEPLPTMLPQQVPEDFPRVDNETQRGRDDTRRNILQDELNAEQVLFDEATQKLKAGESDPEVFKGADGRTYRNVAKYDEKIKPLQEQVDLHKNNIEAIKTELSRLAR